MTDQTTGRQISSTSMAKTQLGPRPFSHVKTVADFEARIRSAWHKSIEGIVEVSTLCIQARHTLNHDELAELKKKLKMSDATFSKLATIGQSPGIINSRNWGSLPSSYGTLYELAKLEDVEFKSKLKEGAIRKDMQREEAEALNNKWRTSKPTKSKKKVLAIVTLNKGEIDPSDLDVLQKALLSLLQCQSFAVDTTPAYHRVSNKSAA